MAKKPTYQHIAVDSFVRKKDPLLLIYRTAADTSISIYVKYRWELGYPFADMDGHFELCELEEIVDAMKRFHKEMIQLRKKGKGKKNVKK